MVSTDDKKVWLGLKSPQSSVSAARPILEVIKDEIGFDTYKSDVEDISSLSEHETYLTDNGFSSNEAEELNGRIQSTYGDWGTWKSFLVDEDPTIEQTIEEYTIRNENKEVTEITGSEGSAGIRVHSGGGTTFNGVSVPNGAVEVFGSEVHFSEKGGSGSREETESTNPANFEYSNLNVNNNDISVGGSTGVSADVTNTGGVSGNAEPQLIVNGSVEDEKNGFSVDPGQTRTVFFTFGRDKWGLYYVGIEGLDPVAVGVGTDEGLGF